MKVIKYPKLSEMRCDKCGATFTLNKFDLKRHKLYTNTISDRLEVNCPVCENQVVLNSYSSSYIQRLKGKIEELFEEKSEELRENKSLYTKDTAVLMNSIYDKITDILEEKEDDIDLDQEDVVEEAYDD